MTFYVENETQENLHIDIEKTAFLVMEEALALEDCPYEVEINVLLTDNQGIRAYNKEYRGIDKETDVLSFPNMDYQQPADFSLAEEREEDYFNPETGELLLGDIIINVDKVLEQAGSYGHSPLREYAFLVAHSMLHLLGYDHVNGEEEAAIMEKKQSQILERLHITRD